MKINTTHTFCCIAFTIMLMSANTQPKLKYTPYQILVWELKANEGYRSWWYEDGFGENGKRAYSIGFGWNDLGKVRRAEIKEFTRDGKVTFDEALKITLYEIAKYKKINKGNDLNKDPLKNLALQLYSYNCGFTNSGKRLGKCCGAKWGCGNKNKNIKKSHGRRRQVELALWNHDIRQIEHFTSENQSKLAKLMPLYLK